MRVITGSARGRRLRTLEGNDVRPTAERVKEAMFSAIQFDIEGRRVLDLFAGSGQLGIEALSRGAAFAAFCDSSKRSVDIVKENLASVGLESSAKVIQTDFSAFLSMTPDKYDIIFLDPPYGTGALQSALALLPRVMSEFAIAVCEHPAGEDLPETVGAASVFKTYRFGKVELTIYRP